MAGLMNALGLNGRQQWALFKVRGKLTLRQFSREPGKLVGVVIAAVILLPIVMGLAAATVAGYRNLPDPWPSQLLGMVLTFLWFIWLLFPIIFFSLNEGLDMRRLLVYPLPQRELALSVVLGTLFDYPTYVVLPLFVAALVGWAAGPAWPIIIVALLLAYGHMILTSQLILTIFGGILQSRRFRDVSIIVFSLLGSSCYFLQIGFQRVAQRSASLFTAEELLALRPLNVLQWLPPGAAARAIVQAHAGAWQLSLLWLTYTAVLLAVVGWVWWRLLQRVITGQGFLINVRPRPEKARPKTERQQRFAWRWPSWLPEEIGQLATKEMKTAWRTPQRRVGLIQGAILPAFFLIPLLATGIAASDIPEITGLGLPIYVAFAFWATGQNMLGWEGNGLPLLLLTPVSRQRIFLAKSVGLTLLSLPVLLLLGIALNVVLRSWTAVVGFLMTPAVAAVVLGVSAVASVLFPIPINLEKKTGGGAFSFGGSCLAGIANAVLVPMTIAILNAPLFGALAIANWLAQPWLAFLAVPVGIIYGGVIFWFGTRLAGNLLLEREPEVIKATRPPGGGGSS